MAPELGFDVLAELKNRGGACASLLHGVPPSPLLTAICLVQQEVTPFSFFHKTRDTSSADEMERMVRCVTFVRVADWLISYVIRQQPDKETLRQEWLATGDRWAARAGWDLTAERVAKSPDGLALPALLDRIESEMASAEPEVQWTMNNTLAAIGIHFPKHRKRAIAIGEKLGIYRDYPVSKGCTSPFAPIWINAMVSRQG